MCGRRIPLDRFPVLQQDLDLHCSALLGDNAVWRAGRRLNRVCQAERSVMR